MYDEGISEYPYMYNEGISDYKLPVCPDSLLGVWGGVAKGNMAKPPWFEDLARIAELPSSFHDF